MHSHRLSINDCGHRVSLARKVGPRISVASQDPEECSPEQDPVPCGNAAGRPGPRAGGVEVAPDRFAMFITILLLVLLLQLGAGMLWVYFVGFPDRPPIKCFACNEQITDKFARVKLNVVRLDMLGVERVNFLGKRQTRSSFFHWVGDESAACVQTLENYLARKLFEAYGTELTHELSSYTGDRNTEHYSEFRRLVGHETFDGPKGEAPYLGEVPSGCFRRARGLLAGETWRAA